MSCPIRETMSLLHVPGACANLGDLAANFAEPSRTRVAHSVLANTIKTLEAAAMWWVWWLQEWLGSS